MPHYVREQRSPLALLAVVAAPANIPHRYARGERRDQVPQKNVARTRMLIETIEHLKGTKKMKTEEMFLGFSVAAGGRPIR